MSEALVATCTERSQSIAAAESCTGGWIAKSLTDVPGSSACFGYGVVSYSNEAKQSLLGVDGDTLRSHGAVSEPVVRAMADGVHRLSNATIAVAVSGVAGPDGGSDDKPVGTVWFAWAGATGVDAERVQFDGGRDEVRRQTVLHALRGIESRLAA